MQIQTLLPRIHPPATAQRLQIARELARIERLPPARLSQLQQRQFALLLRHASVYSPFWRERIAAAAARRGVGLDQLVPADFPPLTRSDLQERFESMHARSPDMGPSSVEVARTSGSTGRPVQVLRLSAVAKPLYNAFSLLDHRWHGRHPGGTLAVVRDMPDGVLQRWGDPDVVVERPARAHVRNLVDHPPEALLAWLRTVAPRYLVTSPAMALRLARLSLDEPGPRPRIEQIVTFGEMVTAELRETVREAFGGRVVDRYTCEEIGYIALQCPKHEHYHVMSANAIVEVVDDLGEPCAPGEVGRVLLTGLHTYAMPLVRYEIGDYAHAGGTCDCGLTLPVLGAVVGRERSFLRFPDGSQRLARLTGEHWRRVAPVTEYRLVQYADLSIEALVTAPRPLADEDRAAIRSMLHEVLGHPFDVVVTQRDALEPLSRWKKVDVIRVDTLRPPDLA
jgi:phenylacetate-CoA ligase